MRPLYLFIVALLIAETAHAVELPAPRSKTRVRTWVSVVEKIVKPNVEGPLGLEVNSFTGNLVVQRGDLFLSDRGLDIDMTLTYNSGLSKKDLGHGRGWSSALTMMYEVTPGHVIIRWGDGRKDSFSVAGSVYTPPVGVFSTLTEYVPGKLLLQTKYGLKFFFDDASHKRLTKIQDLNDNTLVFGDFTPGGVATSITGARYILRAGIPLRTAYIADSSHSPPRVVSYVYDARGNLKTVTDPAGNITRYYYDSRSRMVKMTDPRGNSVHVSYATSGAVSSITTPGTPDTPPTSMTFSYNPPAHQTVVEEVVNGGVQTTTLTFDANGRIIEIHEGGTAPDAQFQYDASNNITQFTDANGNTTLYTYDTKGNCLSETDALSQVALWSYDPLYSRVTSHTDKRGFTTGIIYDARANPIVISPPAPFTYTFAWNTFGNMTSATDGNGHSTSFTYDLAGNVLTASLPIGSHSFTYDNSGRPSSFTDQNGQTTTYVHDMLDNVVSVTDALSGTATYTYDANSNLVSITDANGHTTSFSYNAHDLVVGMTTPAGTSLQVRDEYGNVRQSVDANGNLWQYNYDVKNRLIGYTPPIGPGGLWTRDNLGLVTSSTDPNGNLTGYTYDLLNRLTGVTDALGHSALYTYDANDNIVGVTDANSHVTLVGYDPLNRVSSITHPIGGESFTYDNNGNMLSKTDPNSNTTNYTYDAMNRLILVNNPLLNTTTMTYDPVGNLISVTDPNGLTSSFTHDALGRTTATINPLMETRSYTYDAVGNLTSMTTPFGNVFTFTYDAADRLIVKADALGTIASYTYDPNSNCLTSSDGMGNTTQYLYDARNNLVTITAPLGQMVQYGYDDNSNLISVQDGAGGVTTFGYDALDRNINWTFPGGLTTTAAYDPVGNLIGMTDARGNVTGFLVDANDNPIKTTYADASFKQATYDAAGNMLTLQDQNGSVITYAYDAMNRLTNRGYPDGTNDTYTYDAGGRLTSANNSAATLSFTYDNAGRTLTEVLNGKTTSRTYNVAARTITTQPPSGNPWTTTQNVRLQPVTVATPGASLTTIAYDAAARRVSETRASGITSNYGYNDNSWMTSALQIRAGSPIGGENYTRDNRGFPSTVQKPHYPISSRKHQYSAATRFTEFKEGLLVAGDIPVPVTQTQFVFDASGNRTTSTKDGVPTTYTSNSINAYSGVTGGISMTPAYDANGNMTSDGARAFTFDYMDRMTGFMDVATIAAYAYDALGRRIQKIVNGATTKYFYDGDEVIEERDGADNVTTEYTPSGYDGHFVLQRAGQSLHHHYDAQGSLIAVSDDSGRVVERYEYDAFGTPTILDSAYAPLASSAYQVNPLYGGQTFDTESALYHSGDRTYNPRIGRFMQQDPSSIMGTPPDLGNGYSYAGNNPAIAGARIRPRGWDGTVKGTAKVSRNVLKSYFETGDIPVEDQFSSRASNSQGNRGAVIQFDAVNARGGRKGWDGTVKGTAYEEVAFKTRCQGCGDPWRGEIRGVSSRTVRPPFIPMGGYDGEGDARKGANESAAIATMRTLSLQGEGGGEGVGLEPGDAFSARSIRDIRIVHPPGTPPGTWKTGGNRNIRDIRIVHPPGTPPGTWKTGNRKISDIRIVHPPGTPPGTWKTGGRSIRDIRIVHPPGTPPGTWKTAAPKHEYIVQYRESDWDFVVWPQPGYWGPVGSWEVTYASKIPRGFVAKKTFGQLAGKK